MGPTSHYICLMLGKDILPMLVMGCAWIIGDGISDVVKLCGWQPLAPIRKVIKNWEKKKNYTKYIKCVTAVILPGWISKVIKIVKFSTM